MLEQEQVIAREGRACFCTRVLTSLGKTCAGGGLITLETVSSHIRLPLHEG